MSEKAIVKKRSLGKMTISRKIFVISNTTFLILLSFTFLAPYVNILAKSFNTAKDTMLGGITFYPRVFTLDNYDVVLKDPNILSSAMVSVARVICGSLFSLFLQYTVAYVLLRKKLRFRCLLVVV